MPQLTVFEKNLLLPKQKIHGWVQNWDGMLVVNRSFFAVKSSLFGEAWRVSISSQFWVLSIYKCDF